LTRGWRQAPILLIIIGEFAVMPKKFVDLLVPGKVADMPSSVVDV
jgi:hypothetical protein